MTALKNISIIYSILHALVMFLFLFESRYEKKKTVTLSLAVMLPFILISFLIFVFFGDKAFMLAMFFTLCLPSFIFFFVISKYRDGRFIFTFCMVDTIVLEIIYITYVADHFIPGNLFLFFTRLIIYPLMEWLIYKKFRRVYHDIQKRVTRGWWIFALIGIMYYAAMSVYICYPTMIVERPEYIPVLVILFILMPVSYIHIFITLSHQQKASLASEQENILRLQIDNMAQRMKDLAAADEKFRYERHDFRHKLKVISTLAEKEHYDELRALAWSYSESINKTYVKHYCKNHVLDAVLSTYLDHAENSDIKVSASLDFPENLPIADTELATVFANAIENAINACKKLSPEERHISIKVIKSPKFMFQISNSFNGQVKLDKSGIPVSEEEGHGFGTRSIAAICENHNAYYKFSAENNTFYLRISI